MAVKAVDKMTNRQIFIAVLVIAALYFGSGGFESYLSHTAEVKSAELQAVKDQGLQEIIRKMTENDVEKNRILAEALRQSEAAQRILRENTEGYDSIIRQSTRADSISVQGRRLPKKVIEEITQISRRKAKDVEINGEFVVLGVDATSPHGFSVRLQETGSERIITAAISEALTSEKYRRVVSPHFSQ